MSIQKLSQPQLADWVSSMIQSDTVYGVVARGDKQDRFEYAALSSADQLRLDYDVTLQSPKKYFQPPVETLLTFSNDGSYQSCWEDEKFVVLGVHPYDMVALNQMDALFSQDNYDSHYMKRRQNATIIACDVANASKNVFASSMGTATVDTGYDILLTDIGDGFIAEAATEKGEALLKKAAGSEAVDGDLEKRKTVWAKNKKELNKHVLECQPSYLPHLLERAYDHPVWERKAETCFSCGSCNQVCPTCYCFNVQDDVNWDMKTGKRTRAWDGCLLDGFTKVAGDHEFRKNRADRFRHRLYRKGKYVPGKIGGQIACVGCGRCVGACLPDIANPVTVYNELIDDLGMD